MEQGKFETITLTQPNGEKLAAPIGVWLAAILASLPDPTKNVVNETVAKMIKEATAKSTLVKPGHHVMKAEGFNLGFKLGQGKNGG